MADPEHRRLTRGQAFRLIRLSTLIGVLLVLGGVLVLLAPLPGTDAAREITKAVPRRSPPEIPGFPRYADFISERGDPFAFKQRQHPMPPAQGVDPEPEPLKKPVVIDLPPPLPDTDQLELVGTAPGTRGAYAVFTDQRNGLTSIVAEGQGIRNAVLETVSADNAVLTLGERSISLELTPIPGSAQLTHGLRQYQGDAENRAGATSNYQ